MEVNINFFLITYNMLLDKAVQHLTPEELDKLTCYTVQKKVPKQITTKVAKRINEWELPWNDYFYQRSQCYEYGAMVHLYTNKELIEKLTHVGIMHYDVIFNTNSVQSVISELTKNPDTIFYQMIRPKEQLSLSKYEVSKLCEFMSEKMETEVDGSIAWDNGWISEALSLTPKYVFEKYAKFLYEHHLEILDILKNNRWNIMNHCPHRMCGILERMWGFYLVSRNLPLKQLDIKHDWDSYQHKHMESNGTGAKIL
jgi:hypothetical protein